LDLLVEAEISKTGEREGEEEGEKGGGIEGMGQRKDRQTEKKILGFP